MNLTTGICILAISPCVQIENREEFEGGLHERKEGKRGEKKKKEKSDKTHVKIPL